MAQLKDSISDSHRHDTSEDVHLINRESKVYKVSKHRVIYCLIVITNKLFHLARGGC